ncbi:MAG: restriction endonuclease subunit S [Oceanicaulis sp.]|nr:restriction endonuclease subunit S [Oceanicaulis sp.]
MKATAHILLRDLAQISAGHPVRGAVDRLANGAVALLQMRDIDSDSGIIWEHALRVTPPGKRKPDYLLPGDVIFTSRGARNFAVAVTDVPGRAICAPNLFVLRVAPEGACLPEYLAWFINQRPTQEYFLRSATGTNILNIRREVIENLAVSVPSFEKQKAIIEFDVAARLERQTLRGLIKNRELQMEALALSLAGCVEA